MVRVRLGPGQIIRVRVGVRVRNWIVGVRVRAWTVTTMVRLSNQTAVRVRVGFRVGFRVGVS